MDTLLKLGFVFLLVCGGLLAMGYSQSGRADPLLVAGTVFGLFLAALYFISAARRRNAEKARRKQAADDLAVYQKETEGFLSRYRK